MEENGASYIAQVSLQDLFKEDDEISKEKLERFLTQMVDENNGNQRIDPDALIKVVYDGRLIVMNEKQAESMLNDPTFDGARELRLAVTKALKGEPAYIQQELMVLSAMARMTMDHYKSDPQIDKMELNRLYPLLDRTKHETDQILSEIKEMEDHIQKIRSQHPIITEYESKVGEMVGRKQASDLNSAHQIAQELKSKKKNYLFSCRAMQPDLQGIQFRRLDLQKKKKRILRVHRFLTAQKMDGLRMETNKLKEKIQSIKNGAESPPDASSSPMESSLDQLNELSENLKEKEKQIETINTQDAVYEIDESKTGAVIEDIAHNVLNEPELDISDRISELDTKNRIKPNNKYDAVFKNYSRMVTKKRRKRN